MLLPNLLGFAERAWAKDPDWATISDTAKSNKIYREAWSSFVNVVGKRALPMLDYYAGGFDYRIPKPGLFFENGHFEVNLQFPGMDIRYTIDGTEPDSKSIEYINPVPATGKMLKFRAFDMRGRGGAITEITY